MKLYFWNWPAAVACVLASVACGGNEDVGVAGGASYLSGSDPPRVLSPRPRQVFGQRSVHEGSVNRVVPNKGFHLAGVHVDRSKRPNAIYVADCGNNRVLGFDAFGHCSSAPHRTCTTHRDCSSGTCMNEPGRQPRLVFGQPSLFDHGACNGDMAGRGAASRGTLCCMGRSVISPTETGLPMVMDTDRRGNLFVSDPYNNRVLKYDDPFRSDSLADDVIGQDSFSDVACNKGRSAPGDDTLCFDPDGLDHAGPAVDLDGQGNVWVADLHNSRVLRFPRGSKRANLVLGQPDFASRNASCEKGRPLDQICFPVDVKVKASGEVYVVDQYPAGDIRLDDERSRVLVFSPPLSNGMVASRVVSHPRLARLRNLQFDPAGQGDVWVSDLYKVVLFDAAGAPLTLIGKPDLDAGAFNDDYFNPNLPLHPAYDPKGTFGGIGVDAENNLYIAANVAVHHVANEIVRFPTPVPTSFPNEVHVPNGSLMSFGWNEITGKTVRDNYGMTIVGHDLFISDRFRILVFKNYRRKRDFSHADFVIGCGQFGFCPESFYGGIDPFPGRDGVGAVTGDAHGRLWAAAGRWIHVFETPITQNDPLPLKTLNLAGCDPGEVGRPCATVLWADDETAIGSFSSSLAYDETTDVLWVADSQRRVLRVSNPLGAPRVDLVIGQSAKGNSECNLGNPDFPDARTLCASTGVALDKFKNLYVVDSTYEGGGNRRVLGFDAADLLPEAGNIFKLPAAARFYAADDFTTQFDACDGFNEPCTPAWVAFDARNRMLMSVDSYGNAQSRRFFIFEDPLARQTADWVLDPPFGQAASAYADGPYLAIQDHTWNRVIVYDYPLERRHRPRGH